MGLQSGTEQFETLREVINQRRDVRAEFDGDPLPPHQLAQILAAAHAAPSVGNTQPWDFVMVDDPQVRALFQAHVARERETFAASLPPERAETFSKIKVEGVLESSLGVVVTYDPTRGGEYILGRHAIADAGLYSAVLAIGNFWLAASAQGLGVGWVSFYREDFLADLVGLPDGVRPLAWLCVGSVSFRHDVPDLERHGWRFRRPLADAVHLNTFGRQYPLADAH